ncbi:glutathione S-transferase N-terminal domain-containing protein [Candidatus Kaiserbacteria bacterium]|nr:glutathione S-transferase N-terminal domain-containing protein [Candidatus Kaiserbacteria bacterium]MCB9811971.1 glutathione S-transferase N-terminal domain-containing protein [Candidatus Nomurabacteria bacterium]
MLTLYFKPTCPFCAKVRATLEELQLEVELKDITADDAIRAELIEKGGKGQVPYLIDSEAGVAMYESGDIIAHLQKHYGSGEAADAPKVKVHTTGQTCESCE